MSRLFINYFITKKRFILLIMVELVLFFLYFHIVSPSNFGSFSDTLRYYISALGTLLAVVVSFNTLALQNQMKNMPKSISEVQEQIDKIENLLEPVIRRKESKTQQRINVVNVDSDSKIKNNKTKNDENGAFYDATENLSDAIISMIIIVKDLSKSVSEKIREKNGEKVSKILSDMFDNIFDEYTLCLSTYKKTKHIFPLITISTTRWIQRLKFNTDTKDEGDAKELYESLKRLHVLKSIGYSIFIRNTLADLSKELLFSSIPVIIFIGSIASISNYENYSMLLIRTLFAVSIAIVSIPFILLFIRTLPVLHLIKASSTIPFSRQ